MNTSTNIYPVFITGCQRSGTTLLASMLGSHPNYVATPECQFKVNLASFLDSYKQLDKNAIKLAFDYLNHHFRFLIWDIDLNEKTFFENFLEYNLRSIVEYIVKEYAIQKFNKNPTVWFDHDPESFKYRSIIFKHFPDAKFIHIVRDGRAVAASMFSLDWGPNNSFCAARKYKKNINQLLQAESELGSEKMLRIKYEDLLSSPVETLKLICDWLQIEFHLNMPLAKGIITPEYTKLQHKLVNQKPNKTRSDNWKQKMSDKEIRIFESIAGNLLENLRYECLNKDPKPPNQLLKLTLIIQNLIKRKLNKIKWRARKKRGLSKLNRSVPPYKKIIDL